MHGDISLHIYAGRPRKYEYGYLSSRRRGICIIKVLSIRPLQKATLQTDILKRCYMTACDSLNTKPLSSYIYIWLLLHGLHSREKLHVNITMHETRDMGSYPRELMHGEDGILHCCHGEVDMYRLWLMNSRECIYVASTQ